jgi:hypothetical protein
VTEAAAQDPETLKRSLKSVKASAKVVGVLERVVEVELGSGDAKAAPHLTELLPNFDEPKQRMLLVLDEAREGRLEAFARLYCADEPTHHLRGRYD